MKIQQSTTAYHIPFFLVQSADHVTALTGAAPTVTLSKNCGAFGAAAGAVTEISAGWYKLAANATDNATLGPLALHATAASGDPTDVLHEVVAEDLSTAVVATVTTLTNAPADSTTLTEINADVDEIITTLGAAGAGLTAVPAAVFTHAFGANFGAKTFEDLVGKIVAMLCGPTAGLGTVSEIYKTPVNAATSVTVANDGTNRTTTTLA